VGHIVNTSPGLRSGFSSQYQALPRQMRRAPSWHSLVRRRSKYCARNPSRSYRIRASSTMSKNSGLPTPTSSGVLNTGESAMAGYPGWPVKTGLEPGLDRKKLVQALEPTSREALDNKQQVDVRIISGRPAAHGAEDCARGKAGAVRHPEFDY